MGSPMGHVRTLRLSLIHLTWNILSRGVDLGIRIGSGLDWDWIGIPGFKRSWIGVLLYRLT